METPPYPMPTARQEEVLAWCGAAADDPLRRAMLVIAATMAGDPDLLPRHSSGHVWGDAEATAISPEDVEVFQAAGGFYFDLAYSVSFRSYWAVMPFGDGSKSVLWRATASPARLADGLHFDRFTIITDTNDVRTLGEEVQPCPHHRTNLSSCDPCWNAHHGGPDHALQ